MTRDDEEALLDLRDQFLDGLSKIDRLLCGESLDDDQENEDLGAVVPDDEDFDDLEDPDDEDQEELEAVGIVDPDDASRKREKITPIDYSGIDRRTVAFKHDKSQEA